MVPISFKGIVDKRYISDDGKIYVRWYNEENQYIFEAFPASFEGEKRDGYHFGLYIDTALCSAGPYDMDVISRKDNKYYSSGSLMQLELE